MGAAGTRERIIAAHKYNPHKAARAYRGTRVVEMERTQTFKRRGDIIIDSCGNKQEVRCDGWY